MCGRDEFEDEEAHRTDCSLAWVAGLPRASDLELFERRQERRQEKEARIQAAADARAKAVRKMEAEKAARKRLGQRNRFLGLLNAGEREAFLATERAARERGLVLWFAAAV